MELSELKEKCREIMMTHLESKRYPDMTRQEIINELKPMWHALDVAGLTEELKTRGHSFKSFVQTAIDRAQEAALHEFISNLTGQTNQ